MVKINLWLTFTPWRSPIGNLIPLYIPTTPYSPLVPSNWLPTISHRCKCSDQRKKEEKCKLSKLVLYKQTEEASHLSFSFSQPWPLTQLLLPRPSQPMPSSLARAPLTPSPLNASPRSLSLSLIISFSFVCVLCDLSFNVSAALSADHPCSLECLFIFFPIFRGLRWRNSQAFAPGRA